MNLFTKHNEVVIGELVTVMTLQKRFTDYGIYEVVTIGTDEDGKFVGLINGDGHSDAVPYDEVILTEDYVNNICERYGGNPNWIKRGELKRGE